MRIAILWKDDYPWDVRIEKIARALAGIGNEVFIIARNLQARPTKEIVEKLQVRRLRAWNSPGFNSVVSIPTSLNPLWRRLCMSVCVDERIDLIIVRDLPLLPLAISVGKKLGIPVIFDMAEFYSAMWSEMAAERRFNPTSTFLKNPTVARYLEKRFAPRADGVLAVVEEARAALIADGVLAERIVIVSNTPDLSLFRANPSTQIRLWPDKFVLMYHGHVNVARGLDYVLRCVPEIIMHVPNLLFVIAGDGAGRALFEDMSVDLGIDSHVLFLGWVRFADLPNYIASCDVGIVPHQPTPHKNTTIPNKLFDYMAMGKPVVVSNAVPLRRIVQEEECGLVFDMSSPVSLCDAIVRLGKNKTDRFRMAENASKAVKRRYNWSVDSAVLCSSIRHLESRTDGERRVWSVQPNAKGAAPQSR